MKWRRLKSCYPYTDYVLLFGLRDCVAAFGLSDTSRCRDILGDHNVNTLQVWWPRGRRHIRMARMADRDAVTVRLEKARIPFAFVQVTKEVVA
jgi:hypothetical protein